MMNRPDSPLELTICIVSGLGFITCGLLAKFDVTAYSKMFGFLASLSILVSLFFGTRFYFQRKPFEKQILQQDWKFEGEDKAFVRIPKSEHKRGKYPKIEILKGDTVYGSTMFRYEVLKDGTVEICNPKGTYVIKSAIGECKIVIRA